MEKAGVVAGLSRLLSWTPMRNHSWGLYRQPEEESHEVISRWQVL